MILRIVVFLSRFNCGKWPRKHRSLLYKRELFQNIVKTSYNHSPNPAISYESDVNHYKQSADHRYGDFDIYERYYENISFLEILERLPKELI